jgi:hypothetical protein
LDLFLDLPRSFIYCTVTSRRASRRSFVVGSHGGVEMKIRSKAEEALTLRRNILPGRRSRKISSRRRRKKIMAPARIREQHEKTEGGGAG